MSGRWKSTCYGGPVPLTCQSTLQVSNISDVRWSLLPYGATQHTVQKGIWKKNKPHNKKPSLSCLSKGLDQYTLKAVEQKQNLIHLVSESNSASRHFMGCLLDGTEFKLSLIIYKGAKLIKKCGPFLWLITYFNNSKICNTPDIYCQIQSEKACSRHPKLAISGKQRFFKISVKRWAIQNQAHPANSQWKGIGRTRWKDIK